MDEDTSSIPATPKLGIRVSDDVPSPVRPVEPDFSVRPDAGSYPNAVTPIRKSKLLQKLPASQSPTQTGWHPTKEDLTRLYVDQMLSAAKIAKVYAVSPSKILYQLRKNGISTRTKVESVRRASDELVEAWVKRYQAGHTAEEIAGTAFSVNTVLYQLHKRGVPIRKRQWYQKLRRQNFEQQIFPNGLDEIRRLYLEQHMTCREIADYYGLAEDGKGGGAERVWRRLKELGVVVRSNAESKRKYDHLASEWSRRYQSGESTEVIGEGITSPKTVAQYLRRSGVELRSKNVFRELSPKTPFNGTEQDKAYLLGFTRGDCAVFRTSRSIGVTTGSTHQPMIDLFTSLFRPYGPIRNHPSLSKLTGYFWSVSTYLDSSFEFLLAHRLSNPDEILGEDSHWNYLAGLSDAEDDICLQSKVVGFDANWNLTNTDKCLLDWVERFLKRNDFHPYRQKRGSSGARAVWLCRQEEVKRLLETMPIRHPEKKAKARVVLDSRTNSSEKRASWHRLLASIRRDRDEMVRSAESELAARGKGATNSVLGLLACLQYLVYWRKFPLGPAIWAETLDWLGEYVDS